ncbi:glycosyltransferase family 4 protein [Mesorhizobium sp. BR1-1-16]|uniref:glycosyltransferase family 4 protein n=1 Tax=Mesorhizobium sp. BR1-1-16 TaxID=2876653 RepID=UPI001CCD6624|nr:glycosyltransferase family 4 protein [Mesorhizobium sp. BR1-1-16]MBZ9936965.1 glycosyltransferase family 4 protein [Mesorhizobium sp. BR1-1-16]
MSRSARRHMLLTVDAVGGVWQYAMRLGRKIANHGDRVHFAGLGPRPSPAQQGEAEAIGELVWLGAPLEWMASEEAEVEPVAVALDRVVLDHDIDLLHLNSPTQAVGLRTRKPVVVVSHSCLAGWFRTVRGESVPSGWNWQVTRAARGFARADVVVAPSASHAAMLVACYDALPKIEVVYNAAGRLPAGDHRQPFALAAGRWWDEGKNGAVLEAAAQRCQWRIFAAGATEGPNGASIDFDAANGLGTVAGDELRGLMAQCGVFVSPSIYEPFGLAALEAALTGAPLVLADIPTYRELWDGAAVFFPPLDATALARTIDWLASDTEERLALGEAAHERASRFTLRRQGRAMRAVYEQAVSIFAE